MAKPKPKVGIVSPVITVGGINTPGPGRMPPTRVVDLPHGAVALGSDEPPLLVTAKLNDRGVQIVEGGPQHEVVERKGDVSIVRYSHTEPMRIEVSLLLNTWPDGAPAYNEARIRHLEQLGEPLRTWRLPKIKLYGWPPLGQLLWERDGPLQFEDDPEPIRAPGGWLRIAVTVPLIECVRERTLQHSVRKSKDGAKGGGKGPKFTRVKQGEDSFGDVAKRVYKKRSRAGAIAKVNDMPVGKRLKVGQRLRLP